MSRERRNFNGDFKAKVAIEAIKGIKTTNELAKQFSIHPNQITQWKKQALDHLPLCMTDKRSKDAQDEEDLKASLYQQIGQLKVELDWLKKKTGMFS